MISRSGSGLESRNCAVCHHKTGNYIEYVNKDSVSIQIPVCEKCKDKIGLFLHGPMKAAFSAIQCSITASRFITEDEKTIRELRTKKSGDSDV
jgi:NAD-dependent SIR2 family protein deacetylase